MQEMKAEVRRLWERCFQDTPEFMDLYFHLRYRDELNESIVRDGHLVSALQIIPYELTSWQTRLPMAYLSGVCTHPDARRQGLMRRLLAQTHRRLHREGYPVSTLIPAEPWLFDCYAASGYAAVFDYEWEDFTPATTDYGQPLSIREYREDTQGVYDYFDRKMGERPCCVQHSEDDFRVVMADRRLSKGGRCVARRGHDVAGLAFCVPVESVCRVNECLSDGPDVTQALAKAACERAFVERAELLHPVSGHGERRQLGMLRVIHAEKALSLYARAHPDTDACWRVTDPDIPENNATFRLTQGCCRRDTTSKGEPMDIKKLAHALWASEYPYMSLMLN